MNRLLRMMMQPLTSDRADVKGGQFVCWLAALAVLVFGMLKLAELSLNEAELFVGLLLVMTVVLLMVLIGLVLPLFALHTACPDRSDRDAPLRQV